MQRLKISASEWEIAHRYLDKAPNGTKLPFSALYDANNKLQPRTKKFADKFQVYQTTHSFVKIQGTIYAVAQGKGPDAIIGTGHFAKTKYVENESGMQFVAKIECEQKSSQFFESRILSDRSLLIGKNQLVGRTGKKFYTIMPYLGPSLYNLLEANDPSLTETARLDAIIDLSWEMHQCHHGVGSLSRLRIAHGDIKPENVTRDAQGQFHLVDFGLASYLPNAKKLSFSGSLVYLPATDSRRVIQQTKAKCDVIALKRLIFFPASFHAYDKFVQGSVSRSERYSLLTKKMLDDLGLFPFVDTSSVSISEPYAFADDVTTPASLCALAICAKNKLQVTYADVNGSNPWLGLAIAGLHFMRWDGSAIQEVIDNPLRSKLFGVLTELDQQVHFESYEKNAAVMDMLAKTNSFPRICAYLQLGLTGFKKYQAAALASEITAKAILVLQRARRLTDENISRIVNEERLAALVIVLEENGLEAFYDRAFRSVPLYFALQKIIDDPTAATALALFQERHYTVLNEQATRICRDKDTAAALLRLHKYGLFAYARNIIASQKFARAVVACDCPEAFNDIGRPEVFADYLTDNYFANALTAARTMKQAYALILVQGSGMPRPQPYFQDILSNDALATAICHLRRFNRIQHIGRVLQSSAICFAIANLKDDHSFEAVADLLAIDPTQPLDLAVLTNTLQSRPSALSAANILFSEKVRDIGTFIHVIADSDLVEMVICMQANRLSCLLPTLLNDLPFRRLFFLVTSDNSVSHRIWPILSKFQQQATYAHVLKTAEEDYEFDAAFKMATWELHRGAELIQTKRSNQVSKMLAAATTKDNAIDYIELLDLLGEFKEMYSDQIDKIRDAFSLQRCTNLVEKFQALIDTTFSPSSPPSEFLTAMQLFIHDGKQQIAGVLLTVQSYPQLVSQLNRLLRNLDAIYLHLLVNGIPSPVPGGAGQSKRFYCNFFQSRPVFVFDDRDITSERQPEHKPSS